MQRVRLGELLCAQIQREREERIDCWWLRRECARRVAVAQEPLETTAFSFEGIDGERLMGASTGMGNEIRATSQ